jgi:hypothetical protein
MWNMSLFYVLPSPALVLSPLRRILWFCASQFPSTICQEKTMPESTQSVSKGALWTGRVLSAIPTLLLLMAAVMNLTKNPQAVKGFVDFGYSPNVIVPIGIVALACAVLYAIPQTSVFGAALMTAYLGGAVNYHVHNGQPFWPPILVGIIVWVGLYLREPRLHALAPIRK